jgi:hypothetical protein
MSSASQWRWTRPVRRRRPLEQLEGLGRRGRARPAVKSREVVWEVALTFAGDVVGGSGRDEFDLLVLIWRDFLLWSGLVRVAIDFWLQHQSLDVMNGRAS